MKQQSSSFVNPFRNIYSKVCFYVAALSPKPFSRIYTSAITKGAKVPENPAAQSRSGRHARSTRYRGTDMLGCSYSLASISRFSQAPPDAPCGSVRDDHG
jgi:hypothetical protein